MTYELLIADKNYSSWSMRAWVLMRELEIDFIERTIHFGREQPMFRAHSPSGRLPCLVDGGTVVWDTFAITEHLAERHDGVWPHAAPVRSWARSAAAEMHSGFSALRKVFPFSCCVRVIPHRVSDAATNDLTRIDALWREGLDKWGGPFIAGSRFTAADAFYAPIAARLRTYGARLSEYSMAYAELLLSLQSTAAWDQAALAETFRSQDHDDDVRAAGEVVLDLRQP